MDARFYNSDEIDIERLAGDLMNVYMAQGYQVQQIGDNDRMLVQLKKGSDFEAILGMQAAVSLTIQRTGGGNRGVLAMIGQQRWLDKAAVGTIGIVAFPVLWPLALTAGAGALRQASLGNQVLNMVDGLIRQQRPNIQGGPVPMQLMPQIQPQWGQPNYQQTPSYVPQYVPPQTIVSSVPPAALPAASLRCPQCNTPYEPGDTFCSGCGRSLTPAKVYCTNCNTELKSGVAFCPKCGASTYQAFAAAQKGQERSVPPAAQAPTPTVTYTPPTPPVQPPAPKREEVYYTPSAQSQPTVESYTPPKPVAPTPPPQPPRPTPQPEVRYVPPVTQDPSVAPQPMVTYTQATPAAPKPTPPAPKREEVYYVPSAQQAPSPSAPTVSAKAQPQQPMAAKPVAQSAVNSNVEWGTLTFSDGVQVVLKGERALIGRYDHDIGGVQPEVDLSKMQGADTVSRIHAALEHVGNTYTLTDLNSTNATRINGKRLEPDTATPINDGDTLYFGRVSSTFKKK